MMLKLMAVALCLPIFFAKAATNHCKELFGTKKISRISRGHHPAHYACTD
ncbi:hypothetical protein MJK72_07195 [Klebsiella pneumoniae]|nr:hypothetical protein MJK72_07195 [Klebsiella pneumoniae]